MIGKYVWGNGYWAAFLFRTRLHAIMKVGREATCIVLRVKPYMYLDGAGIHAKAKEVVSFSFSHFPPH